MKLLFQRVLMWVNKTQRSRFITALFFFLIFFGLLLGDGKQGLVEVYGAASILVLWVFHVIYNKPEPTPLPKQIHFSWVLLFVATAVSTIASISVGFSFSWIVRLLSGYVVYRLFVDLAPNGGERLFSRCLLIFIGAAGALSLCYYLFPGIRSITPSMNLLSASFGHSHLADLLVFVFPLVLVEVFSSKSRLRIGLLVMYFVMLLSTMARASWAIVMLYATFVFRFANKTAFYKKALIAALSIVVIGVVYIGLARLFSLGEETTREFYTRPRSLEVRVLYWQQALDGFIDSPLLGNGPGTFSLVSFRHQRYPTSSSWFAHSAPLQIWAEMGVVGIVTFGFLIFSHIRFWYKQRRLLQNSQTHTSLIWGLALVFIYSCFEFVLDYFIVWLLFWAAAGVITGTTINIKSGQPDKSIKVAVAAIGIFYFFWVAGSSAGIFMKRHDIAFFLAPFDTTQSLIYMSDVVQNKHPLGERLISIFHRKNPRLLYEISKTKKNEGNIVAYGNYSKEAVFADPQNIELLSHYLAYLTLLEDGRAGDEMLQLLRRALPKHLESQVNALQPYAREIDASIKHYYTNERPRLRERYLSALYVIGLHHWQSAPQLTLSLWTLAKDTLPDLGAIHVEIARLYQHSMHDDSAAQAVLQKCTAIVSARKQCEDFMNTELLPPGDFYDALY